MDTTVAMCSISFKYYYKLNYVLILYDECVSKLVDRIMYNTYVDHVVFQISYSDEIYTTSGGR